MSTKYFLIENSCKCCGRGSETEIGSSSFGWVFRLKSGKYLTLEQWIPALIQGIIKDEYGKTVSFESLTKTITCREFGEKGLKFFDTIEHREVIFIKGNTWRMTNDY